ncbi:DNA cytosine methyltransferase [Agrobacterium salinitolerans]|uniref:DNA cytosine methyltransferase n=1 Tax=Agrobacterium salinitolerans TaxID=1183413 RepID=UPI0022B90947|nr:DNA cytosine methyltransferase [Agrobacterium salinitolerans]MCZ7854819.1 DNA cytosine methyltransferase [Agrobacterium salinitolerans]
MDENLDEQRLFDEAKALRTTLSNISTLLTEAAKAVQRIESETSEDVAATLLSVWAGASEDDIRLLLAASELFDGDNTLARTDISLSAVRLLRRTSSEEVRANAIRLLEAGAPLDEAKLQQLEIHRNLIDKGADRVAMDEKSLWLESLAARQSVVRVFELQDQLAVMLDAAARFANLYGPGHPQNGLEMEEHRAGYAEAHAALQTKATTVLAEFDRLFGDDATGESASPKDSQSLELIRCRQALARFASGEFGHRGGFAFNVADEDVFSWEIIDALHGLSCQTKTKRVRPLSVLEIGGGAGGQALGLMSAGFKHVAIYENVLTRVKTLKANWPTWPVVEADVRSITDTDFSRYRGIDLLAGSISSCMVAKKSKREMRGGEDDLVPELLRAARLMKPRAILVECQKGMMYSSHLMYYAGFKAALAELGYVVEFHRLDMKEFGLPREDERVVIVGIRCGERGTFTPPALRKIVHRNVWDALGDLVVRYESPEDQKQLVVRGSQQHRYDEWARMWRSRTSNPPRYIKAISRSGTENREERKVDPWGESHDGFDRSGFAVEPPKVQDCPFEDDNYHLPKMTQQMAARAQGFPDGWMFAGKGTGNIDMIADALPPVLAKAVGLQIRTALTGETFDLDALLAKPIVNLKQIGRGDYRLNGGTENADVMTKLEPLLRGSVAIEKERRVKRKQAMLREILNEVEPNHMDRTHLVEVLRDVLWERERQAREDHTHMDRLFPDGEPEGFDVSADVGHY